METMAKDDTAEAPKAIPFANIAYYISPTLPFEKAEFLRGLFDKFGGDGCEKERAEDAEYVITDSTHFAGWENARWAVSPYWVERSAILNKLQPPQYYSPDPAMLFSGVIACATQLAPRDMEVLSAGILALGGQWRSGLTKDCTHLFALRAGPLPDQSSTSAYASKYATAVHFQANTNIKIVLPHWFEDVLRLGYARLSTVPYEFPDPPLLRNEFLDDDVHAPTPRTKVRVKAMSGEKDRTKLSVYTTGVRYTPSPNAGYDDVDVSMDVGDILDGLHADNRDAPSSPTAVGGSPTPGPSRQQQQHAAIAKTPQVWNGRRILLSRQLKLQGTMREAVVASIQRAGGVVVHWDGCETWPEGVEAGEEKAVDEEEEAAAEDGAVGPRRTTTDAVVATKKDETPEGKKQRERAEWKERELDRLEAGFVKRREVDVVIGRWRDGRTFVEVHQTQDMVLVGTLAWLYHVQRMGVVSAPADQLLHYPVPREVIDGFGVHEVTLTNYTGEAREYLKKVITTMGGRFTPSMSGKTGVLVAATKDSAKALKALKWGIPVVNHTWLEDCFVQWRNLPIATEKYIRFPEGVDFTNVLGERGVDVRGYRKVRAQDAALKGGDVAPGTPGAAPRCQRERTRLDGEVAALAERYEAEDWEDVKWRPTPTPSPPSSPSPPPIEVEAMVVDEAMAGDEDKDEGDREVASSQAEDEDMRMDWTGSAGAGVPVGRGGGNGNGGGSSVIEKADAFAPSNTAEREEAEEVRGVLVDASDEEEEEEEPPLPPRRSQNAGSGGKGTHRGGADRTPRKGDVGVKGKGKGKGNGDSDSDVEIVDISPRKKAASPSKKQTPGASSSGAVAGTTKKKEREVSESSETEEDSDSDDSDDSLPMLVIPARGKDVRDREAAAARAKAEAEAEAEKARVEREEEKQKAVEKERAKEKEKSATTPKKIQNRASVLVPSSAKVKAAKEKEKAKGAKEANVRTRAKAEDVMDVDQDQAEVDQKKKGAANTKGKAPSNGTAGGPSRGSKSAARTKRAVDKEDEDEAMDVDVRASSPLSPLPPSSLPRKPRRDANAATNNNAPVPLPTTANASQPPGTADVDAHGRSRRSAAAKASAKLRDEVMPDLVHFEEQRRKSRKGAKGGRRESEFFVVEGDTVQREAGASGKAQAEGEDDDDDQEEGGDGSEAEEGKAGAKRRRKSDGGGEGKGKARGKGKGNVKAEESEGEVEDVGDRGKKKRRVSAGGGAVKDEPGNLTLDRPISILATQVKFADGVVKKMEALGAKFTDKPQECTHLVAKGLVRTEKFLCALARAPFIVSEAWVNESAKAKKVLSEDDYALHDPAGEARYGVALKDALERAKANDGKLLAGKTFYLTPKVQAGVQLMKSLVGACGGTVATAQPTVRILKGGAERYVISHPDDARIWRAIADAGFPVYSQELVLMGVLRQRVDWEDKGNRVDLA